MGVLTVSFEDLQKVRNRSKRKPNFSRWYTAAEVATHSSATDCWMSSPCLPLFLPISTCLSWRMAVKTSATGLSRGRSMGTATIMAQRTLPLRFCCGIIPPGACSLISLLRHAAPSAALRLQREDEPWWVDPRFVIGNLSLRSQLIRIKNILTNHVTSWRCSRRRPSTRSFTATRSTTSMRPAISSRPSWSTK